MVAKTRDPALVAARTKLLAIFDRVTFGSKPGRLNCQRDGSYSRKRLKDGRKMEYDSDVVLAIAALLPGAAVDNFGSCAGTYADTGEGYCWWRVTVIVR